MVLGKGGLLNKIFLPGFVNAGADTSFATVGEEHPNEDSEVLLKPFALNVWIAEGPVVSFYGFLYPTRMVAIKLSNGGAWIWSPIELTEELATQVVQIVGPVRYIVSPNAIHWLFIKKWQENFPSAKLYASPGLAERQIAKDLKFGATLSKDAPAEYANDIDQVIFQGGVLDEVVFFHKPSSTVIFCDLIQRHFEKDQTGFKGWLMRADGLVGPMGGTPKEWTFFFWVNGLLPEARTSLDIILSKWQPEKLIIAHGENAPEGATFIIENCLPWIPKEPNQCHCCVPRKQ